MWSHVHLSSDKNDSTLPAMGRAAFAAEVYLGDVPNDALAGSPERIRQDRENVRAIRNSRIVCHRCTFCGRCKRGSKRRPKSMD